MARATIDNATARRIWLTAQRLDTEAPFGAGAPAVAAAVDHLGYVQIDTIHVVERCHHHMLFNRIPGYRRADLHGAQSRDKSVFEYWTHALAYVPAKDYRYFMPAMKAHRDNPGRSFGSVRAADLRRVMSLIRRRGPLSIRDIEDRVLVEKDHAWGSRKPSKRALQLAFFGGRLTVAERIGMLKTFDLTERHFGWERRPRPASERQVHAYMLDRALRSQGLISLDSVCHLDAPSKGAVGALIERRMRARKLVAVTVEGDPTQYWATRQTLETVPEAEAPRTHILSPFDPLIIQRKRSAAILGYGHVFEAYVAPSKRRFGYFALPVLIGSDIVAAIDFKADRQAGRLEIRQWTWTEAGDAARDTAAIEAELDRFERFQLAPE